MASKKAAVFPGGSGSGSNRSSNRSSSSTLAALQRCDSTLPVGLQVKGALRLGCLPCLAVQALQPSQVATQEEGLGCVAFLPCLPWHIGRPHPKLLTSTFDPAAPLHSSTLAFWHRTWHLATGSPGTPFPFPFFHLHHAPVDSPGTCPVSFYSPSVPSLPFLFLSTLPTSIATPTTHRPAIAKHPSQTAHGSRGAVVIAIRASCTRLAKTFSFPLPNFSAHARGGRIKLQTIVGLRCRREKQKKKKIHIAIAISSRRIKQAPRSSIVSPHRHFIFEAALFRVPRRALFEIANSGRTSPPPSRLLTGHNVDVSSPSWHGGRSPGQRRRRSSSK